MFFTKHVQNGVAFVMVTLAAPTMTRHSVTLEVDSLFSHRFQHLKDFDITVDAAVGSDASLRDLTSQLHSRHPVAADAEFLLQWKIGTGLLEEWSAREFSPPLDHRYDPYSCRRHFRHSRTSGAMATPQEPARHHACSFLGCSTGHLLALPLPLRLGDVGPRGGWHTRFNSPGRGNERGTTT